MDDTKKLFELIDKEIVDLKEFQYIANHDFVSEVKYVESNTKYPDYAKYIVKYINADSDSIYLKR